MITNGSGDDVSDGDPVEVIEVEGQAALVGQWIDLAAGGRIRLQADGALEFHPDGDFDNLTTDGYQTSRQVVFSYTVNGGDTATVTITVTGAVSDGDKYFYGGGADAHDFSARIQSVVVNGGDGNDAITGSSGNDSLRGDGADDGLYGDEGADKVYGGTGADNLYGGGGNDILEGDDGDDTLYGGDKIDLSSLDANLATAENDAFVFVAKFTKQAGQAVLLYNGTADATTLRLDADGDGKADYEIVVNGDQRDPPAVDPHGWQAGWVL